MSLATMIAEFNDNSERLRQSIADGDHVQISVHDLKISRVFSVILSAEPADASERVLLAEFLLEHLAPSHEGTELMQKTRDKIIMLVQPDLVAIEAGQSVRRRSVSGQTLSAGSIDKS